MTKLEKNPLWLDIGGGSYAREGFTNVDISDTADVRVNFESDALPFDSDTITKIYTSHTLEHVANVFFLLQEMTRIAAEGCECEIRVPHFTSISAMCPGHEHVISTETIKHFHEFTDKWIHGKWIRCRKIQHVPTGKFAELKAAFPQITSDVLIATTFIGACHEIVCHCVIETMPKGWTREHGVLYNSKMSEFVSS